MSAQENVETVKKFFAAMSDGDTQGLLAAYVYVSRAKEVAALIEEAAAHTN